MLQLDVPSTRLDEMYGDEDYYWYLHTPEFRDAFLRPLAEKVNGLGGVCLDVGCGCGWLSEYLRVPYVGLDGSATAIAEARKRYPGRLFQTGRLEDPGLPAMRFTTIVFGNVLYMIHPQAYLSFLELYRVRFGPKWFVIYDLSQLDTTEIEARFRLVDQMHGSVELKNIPDVKKHRKILVFSCN